MQEKKNILCLFIIACLLGGCQKTPDQQIVREKGKDSIAQYEQDTESSEAQQSTQNSLQQKLEAPEKYESSIHSEDGNFEVVCNAEIEIPDVSQVHVYEVSQKTFDQALADQFAEVFAGTKEVYDPDSYFYLEEKQLISVQVPIPELENYFSGIFEREGEPYLLFMKTETAMPMTMEMQKQDKETLESTGYYERNGGAWNDAEVCKQMLEKQNITPEILKEMAGITAEEAQSIADQKVEQFGIPDMKAREQILSVHQTILWDENGELQEDTKWNAAWKICYTREIDGFPVTYDEDGGIGMENMDDVTTPWGYETLQVVINGEGIQQVICYDLYDVGEKTVDNVKLKPFSEIMDIFEEMIQIQNANMGENGILSKKIQIDRITLGYGRIYDPNSAEQSGLLVPVWDFYGSEKVVSSYEGERMEYENTDPYMSKMTINAIDGTIIERSLGY